MNRAAEFLNGEPWAADRPPAIRFGPSDPSNRTRVPVERAFTKKKLSPPRE